MIGGEQQVKIFKFEYSDWHGKFRSNLPSHTSVFLHPFRALPTNGHSSSPVLVTFGFIVDDLLEVDEKGFTIVLEHKMSMSWVDKRIKLADWVGNVSALSWEQTFLDIATRFLKCAYVV